jgi:hypothetical protein
MSWWDSNREVLGDRPADALSAAWRRALADEAPRPTLAEMLTAYASSIRRSVTSPPFSHLVLKRPGQPNLVFDGFGPAPAPLCEAFERALTDIGQAYADSLQRSPTPMELAKTMAFVVSAEPQTYLDDPADHLAWRQWQLLAEPSASPDLPQT